MLNRSASLAMSTSVLKALPGKLDIKRHSPSILYNSLQAVPCRYCGYAGIVLLEEKTVSIDWQDMWVKDFINISLACK